MRERDCIEEPSPAHPLGRLVLRLWLGLTWRAVVIGVAAFVTPTQVQTFNVLALLVAMVWCFYDDRIASRHGGAALALGAVLYILSMLVTRLLVLMFGMPVFAD